MNEHEKKARELACELTGCCVAFERHPLKDIMNRHAGYCDDATARIAAALDEAVKAATRTAFKSGYQAASLRARGDVR